MGRFDEVEIVLNVHLHPWLLLESIINGETIWVESANVLTARASINWPPID